MKTIKKWQDTVHTIAQEKGWFEVERSSLELHMLMVSEISEATEEVRNHKPHYYLENLKPEGETIELVDVLLRIFDYAGYRKYDLEKYLLKVTNQEYKENTDILSWSLYLKNSERFQWARKFDNQLDAHMFFVITLAEASKAAIIGDTELEASLLATSMLQIFQYFIDNNWGIEEYLDIKHNFNVNRPYKHGGKKC